MSVRLMVMLVALTLGLGACDQEPKPIMPDPSSGSPSTGHPSTPDASELGPKAFIREYFRRVSEATTTGDPESFQELSAASCRNCRAVAENVRDAFRGDAYVATRSWRQGQLMTQSHDELIYRLRVFTPREEWYSDKGELDHVIDARWRWMQVQLRSTPRGYLVTGLDIS